MAKSFSDKQQLKAFITAAQYLAGLTSGQDIWEQAGKVLVKFFGADFAAFGRQHTDGAIEIDHWVFSERGASVKLSEHKMIAAVGDVFESSFLTFISIQSDDPTAAAFFPILHENHVIAVMLAGRLSASHLENEILDLYLAVAGLIGATYSRKISEMAVLQAKDDWERTFEAVPDAIVLLDLEFRIVRANKAMAVKLGITPEECVGLTCYGTICGESRPPLYCPYVQVLEKGHECALEMHDDRLAADYFVTVSPLRGKDGRLVGGVHVARDITEHKLAKKELERYKVHLEDLIEERTAELTAANKELERFSYSVSHDLRAPLRHISGYMELLQKRLENRTDVKTRDYMDAISEASKKMGTLIDDLLNFSRLGRSEIQKKKVSINTLVRTAIGDILHETKGRDIIWEVDELPDVYGDQSMLSLMFTNLISNAVKYTSTRPCAEIKIGYKEDKDEIIFSVKDNGVGFDMKYADKLFGVFQRLHSQSEFEGIGIGLANVQRIILRHGGRVWAEGAVGQGAAFYFTLPLKIPTL
jgi:PAS domain S-box-containing protein